MNPVGPISNGFVPAMKKYAKYAIEIEKEKKFGFFIKCKNG